VSVRSFAQNLFQRLGWDVRRTAYPSSEEVLLTRFLSVARPTAVFDVGANIGQYGLSLRKCGFTGRIVSFEAIPSVHARLSAVAARDRDWRHSVRWAARKERPASIWPETRSAAASYPCMTRT
jgi:hypothetical protein